METIRRSWFLVKSSWRLLIADRELLIFPILASIATVIEILVLVGLYFLSTGLSLEDFANKVEMDQQAGLSFAEFAVVFLIYFVSALVATFFNAALIGGALMRLRGGDPTVGYALKLASSRIVPIVGYSAIAATVGMAIRLLRGRSDSLGNIGASFLSFGWGVMTFLVVPVLVAEQIGPVDAIKRSGSLLRKTWGEQIVGSATVGIVGFLVAIPVVLVGGLFIYGAAGTDSDVLLVSSVVLLVLALAVIGVIFSALNAIYRAAVYEYAAEQIVAPQFGSGTLETAFRQK